MAAIPISISGVLYDKTARTQQPVYIIGNAQIVGLSVGGGPIVPPDEVMPPDPGGPGVPPHPAFPIWGPPGSNFPDSPGYPPVVGGGPIIPPDPPELPPGTPPSSVVKEAPATGGWGYYTDANSAMYGAYRPAADQAGPR